MKIKNFMKVTPTVCVGFQSLTMLDKDFEIPPVKIYFYAERTPEGSKVTYYAKGKEGVKELEPRFDLCSHSPTGFEWGYAGNGLTQLALALLANVSGADKAIEYYQQFKNEILSGINSDKWMITDATIITWLACAQAHAAEKKAEL